MPATLQIDVKDVPFMSSRERKAAEALVRRGVAEWVDEDEIINSIEPRFREAARHLTPFCEATGPWMMEDWQDIINDRLTRMVNDREKGVRLLLHAPPQNGKSIITSQRFPAYILGHYPADRIRLACYNETHAEAFGEVIQSIVKSEDYKQIFPSSDLLIEERAPKGRWSTAARLSYNDAQPSFLAMGLNTGFVGQGADWLIIDDPYKNREEAFSKVINERIWRFWAVTGKQRISPETNVIVIFHRWARNDLAGRLMEEEEGWETMRFPALCDGGLDDPTFVEGLRKAGDALTPRRPKTFLVNLRDSDPLTFFALQQGNPQPEGGQQFQMDKLRDHDITPQSPSLPLLDLYQGVDLAISLKQTADFTAIATIGVSNQQDLFILDINYERVGFHGALAKMESEAKEWTVEKHNIIGIGVEANAYQASFFQEAMLQFMLPFTEVHPKTDKLTRAQLFMRRVAAGKVYVNMSAEWWPELRRQMYGVADPSVHDDLVDAIVNALEQLPIGSIEDHSPLPAPNMSLDMLEEELELERLEEARTRLN